MEKQIRSELEALRDKFLERSKHGTTKAGIETWWEAAEELTRLLYLDSIGYFEDDA